MPSDWYKDAIFYEVYVRGFYDSSGDGVGDFRGLTAKLDYLQWLGITCIWLLPFYESPLRDGGYDISDYYAVLPDYGTIADFKQFLSAAHDKGIRVIADLVINHTSDQHPWFQDARSSPRSPKRDWYVWSDSDQKYSQARIILLTLNGRTGHGTSRQELSTGIAFLVINRISTTTILKYSKRCSMWFRSGLTLVFDGFRWTPSLSFRAGRN